MRGAGDAGALGELLLLSDRHAEAVRAFRSVDGDGGSGALARNSRWTGYLGGALHALGRHAEAVAALRGVPARALAPDAALRLGHALAQLRRLDEAAVAFREIAAPSKAADGGVDVLATLNLGLVLADLRGRAREATAAFEAVLATSPGLEDAWLGLATAQLALGEGKGEDDDAGDGGNGRSGPAALLDVMAGANEGRASQAGTAAQQARLVRATVAFRRALALRDAESTAAALDTRTRRVYDNLATALALQRRDA